MPEKKRNQGPDPERARAALDANWAEVAGEAEGNPEHEYLDDAALRSAIRASINHRQVAYRFCLPVQLLGKLVMPEADALALQSGRGKQSGDSRTWDARSLASKVVAPFNQLQENVLGTSADPYVGNAMRIPRMRRDDPSKKDIAGWNVLIDVLEAVERRDDPAFTEAVFRQVLLEFQRRQKELRFSYPVPPRVSLAQTLRLASRFLEEKSGGDRALALAGALFDVIGDRFGLFANVGRGRINASDEASGQAADLECLDGQGQVVMAVEVKDRALTLSDLEGTITKTRRRKIRDVFFAAPRIVDSDREAVDRRIEAAFSAGQNVYHAALLSG
jgi:hypothetical protein